MYIIYIFRTIALIFVAMFITTFRPLDAPAVGRSCLVQVVGMSNQALYFNGVDCSKLHDTVDKGVG